MKSTRGLEPFTNEHVVKYLHREHGATFKHQAGSHQTWRLSDGTEVGTGHPQHPMTKTLLKQIARRLGKSYGDLRTELGFPVVSTGRSAQPSFRSLNDARNAQREREYEALNQASKSRTLETLAAIRAEVDEWEAELRCGIRSADFYRRVLSILDRSLAVLLQRKASA